MTESPLRNQLIKHFGPAKFNKFLRSIHGAEKKGRLFFWQERFIEQARNEGMNIPDSLEALVTLFAEQETEIVPLSKEEFLAEPLKIWGDDDFEIPEAWIEEAVHQPEFRDRLSDAVSRSVSKVGDFSLAPHETSLLASQLSPEEAVVLYCWIRDNSQRLEQEWRAEFEETFPESAELLPELEQWLEDPKTS